MSAEIKKVKGCYIVEDLKQRPGTKERLKVFVFLKDAIEYSGLKYNTYKLKEYQKFPIYAENHTIAEGELIKGTRKRKNPKKE